MSGSVTPTAVKIAAEARSSESTTARTMSTLTLSFWATISPATPPRRPDVVRNDAAANFGTSSPRLWHGGGEVLTAGGHAAVGKPDLSRLRPSTGLRLGLRRTGLRGRTAL